MNNRIVAHIEHALMIHPCVVMPELGGFVTQSIPAKFCRERHLATPPQQQLLFNPRLNHRDGLLEESYAHTYGVSLRKARIMLDDDIAALRHELVRKRSYAFGSLGVFELSNNGQIYFRPEQQSEFCLNHSAYGMTSVSLPLLSAAPITQTTEAVNTIGMIPSTERTIRDDKYFHLTISKRFVQVAAAIIILIVGILPFRSISENAQLEQQYSATFVPTELTAGKLWHIHKEPVAEPEPEVKQTSPITAEAAAKRGYYVIVGTLHSAEKALLFFETNHLNDAKWSNAGILDGAPAHRIFTNHFENAQDAYTYIAKLRQEHPEFSQAWVYQLK